MWFYLTNPVTWLLFLGTVMGTLLLTPLVIRLARRVGAVDRGGYRKINGRQIPLMGGLAVIVPMLALCLLGLLWPDSIFYPQHTFTRDLVLLALGGLMIAALGIVDDIRTLRARHKFLGQLIVALVVCFGGRSIRWVELPGVGAIDLGVIGGGMLTVLWVIGMINAFNLVDGVDGLAAGLALVSAIGLGIIAALNDQTLVVVVCLCLSGSLAAFLIFNFHPAKIFLGDTGSLFLGFIMAMLPLLGNARTSGTVTLLAPILALGFPIFDTLTSMARRSLRGRNPFVGDRAHTHHRLLNYGYSQRQVVLILYTVALICTGTAVLSQIHYPHDRAPLIAVGIYATVLMALAWANGYLRLHQAVQICRCRRRNSMLKTFIRFAMISFKHDSTLDNLKEIMRIGCREMHLGFLEVTLASEFLAGELEENGKRNHDPMLRIDRVESGQSGVYALDAMETLYVMDAANHRLMIRYRIDNRWPADDDLSDDLRQAKLLEGEDVMACLAELFSSIQLPEHAWPATSRQRIGRYHRAA